MTDSDFIKSEAFYKIRSNQIVCREVEKEV